MKRILIDTDLIIDLLRGYPPAQAFFKNLQEGVRKEEITPFISVITEAELQSGANVEDPKQQAGVDGLMGSISKIMVDSSTARTAGDLRRRRAIPLLDALLAATALEHGMILCTRNRKDFLPIKGLKTETPY